MGIPLICFALQAGRDSNHLNANVRWTFARWVGPRRHLTMYSPKGIHWQRVPSGIFQNSKSVGTTALLKKSYQNIRAK